MGWGIVAALIVAAIVWWRKAAKDRDMRQLEAHNEAVTLREADYSPGWRTTSAQTPSGVSITLTSSVREYDANKYRFDGLARPEWQIEYADEDGVVTERQVYVDRWWDRGGVTYYDCWCYLRDQRRTFRSDRVLGVRNLDTNRKVKSIHGYLMR